LYDNNILHRDLKPDNILFNLNCNDFVLKLADFGFSRTFNKDDVTLIGNAPLIQTYCGTPVYMAPEMLLHNSYNIKADLWSLGIILYETMYGDLPYKNIYTMNDLKNIIENKQIHIDEQNYSRDCICLLKSLLEYDPIKRISWEHFFEHDWFTTNNIPSELFFTAKSQIIKSIVQKPINKQKRIKQSIINSDTAQPEHNIEIITRGVKCYDVTESCVMVDLF